jgi:hypothetical protein
MPEAGFRQARFFLPAEGSVTLTGERFKPESAPSGFFSCDELPGYQPMQLSLPGIKPASAITRLTWLRRARIYDYIAAKRACMYPRSVSAGVGIICHPGVALDMRLKHEYVPASRGNHSRSRRGSGKAKPVSCEV